MRYNCNHDIYRKVNLFFEADNLKNVELACKKLGYKRSYYYYWWNRLKQGDWKIQLCWNDPAGQNLIPTQNPGQ
jgi:hypothetical protein